MRLPSTIRRAALLAMVANVVFADSASAQDAHQSYMDRCEQAKQSGDFEKMENAILGALRHGPGDEYAWRSLAWAQGRQGKWDESLRNALENITRNGESGWSLAQLAESALGLGDIALGRRALDRTHELAPESLAGSEGALKACADRLLSLTAKRVYSIQVICDLKQGGSSEPPVCLLIPQMHSRLQSFSFRVRNVIAYRVMHVGIRDYIAVVQRPGEPFVVEGKLTLWPFCLGSKRLAQVPAGECPSELLPYLTEFQNASLWDPQHPEIRAIARSLKGRTSARTVQNILDWFKRNIRYDATIKDDPALGQLGTILKLRSGGCHHNSGLFVTICRAAGVPACVAHGNCLPVDEQEFHLNPAVGHGWAEVFINTIGWVSVEPMDADSLRTFTANRAYMAVGASNRPPESHHFAATVNYQGENYRVVSIQGCEIKGKLIGMEAPAKEAPRRKTRR